MNHILAVGLNMADIYVEEGRMYPGGNEVNVAVYAHRLGFNSGFLGVFGDDAMASCIRKVLKTEKVDLSRCRSRQGETGVAFVRLIENDRVFAGGNNGGVTGAYPISIQEEDIPYIESFDVVTTSRFGRMKVEEVIRLCEAGRPVAYDFSSEEPEMLPAIGVYLTYSFFCCENRNQAKTRLRQAYALGCPYNIATMGAQGAVLYDGRRWYFQEAVPVRVIDTMGAGDSFLTAFLLNHRQALGDGINHGDAITSALEKAARFAAETCQQKGASGYEFLYPSLDEVCKICNREEE